nr:MAG TPA: hypothetical protein [Microviridae sp.]
MCADYSCKNIFYDKTLFVFVLCSFRRWCLGA